MVFYERTAHRINNGIISKYVGQLDVAGKIPDLSMGTKSDGTISGGVTITDRAMVFNGSDGSVSIADNVLFDLSKNFGISFWVNTTSTSLGRIFYKRIDGDNAWQAVMTADGTLSFASHIETVNYRTSSTTSINDGNWHSVIAYIDNDLNIKIFIDGVEEATYQSTTIARAGTDNSLFIGKRADDGSYFNGSIDEATIFNKIPTQSEASFIYRIGRQRGEATRC
jgi:trimeric autotransporter adhesin